MPTQWCYTKLSVKKLDIICLWFFIPSTRYSSHQWSSVNLSIILSVIPSARNELALIVPSFHPLFLPHMKFSDLSIILSVKPSVRNELPLMFLPSTHYSSPIWSSAICPSFFQSNLQLEMSCHWLFLPSTHYSSPILYELKFSRWFYFREFRESNPRENFHFNLCLCIVMTTSAKSRN